MADRVGWMMKCWRMLVIFWLIVVAGLLAIPPLAEKYFWDQLEHQAVRADVAEGQQR